MHEIMNATVSHPTVKVIGANGQISLGKQFAGRQVLVEEREPGVWIVRTADLRSALTWGAENAATDDNTDALMQRLSDGLT